MRRTVALLLALGLLTTVPLGSTVGKGALADVEGKLDEPLRAALAGHPGWARWTDAEGRLTVLVLGPEHPLPAEAPTTRAGWNAHWAAQAAPFLADVKATLRAGDVLSSYFPTVPLVAVRVQPDRVADVAAPASVRSAGLDWPEAVRVAPVPNPDGPSGQLDESVPLTQAPDVWAQGFRGEGVLLAMIDTGIEGGHDMMLDYDGTSRVIDWYDATNGPNPPCSTPCDTDGHGTHTATTAAGSKVSGGRFDGVAPRADVLGVRIFQGSSGAWEDAIEGLQAAFDRGADITSNSWGGGCGNSGSEGATDMARNLANAGMQSIFTIGNNGPGASSFGCPGREDKVITVGATDKSKVIAGFSSRGPCNDTPGGPLVRTCPDVVTVGVNVEAGCLGNSYCGLSGTSMAAPQVAGAAVLMHQMKKALQGGAFSVPTKQLESFFTSNAQDLGSPGADNAYGAGFVQLRPMRDTLVGGALARASIGMTVDLPEIRASGTNGATITVTNTGTKALSGTVRLVGGGSLFHDGHEFGAQALSLAPGQSGSVHLNVPGTGLFPSTYSLVGTYDYTWDNGGSPVDATLSALGSFLLRGAYVQPVRQLFGANNTGSQVGVQLTYRSIGNEPATMVSTLEAVPLQGYVMQTSGAGLSNPPQDTFEVNLDDGSFDMTHSSASIAPGAVFQVSYNVRNLLPGDHTFRSEVAFTDGAGVRATVTSTQTSTVCAPFVQYPGLLGFLPNPTGC